MGRRDKRNQVELTCDCGETHIIHFDAPVRLARIEGYVEGASLRSDNERAGTNSRLEEPTATRPPGLQPEFRNSVMPIVATAMTLRAPTTDQQTECDILNSAVDKLQDLCVQREQAAYERGKRDAYMDIDTNASGGGSWRRLIIQRLAELEKGQPK